MMGAQAAAVTARRVNRFEGEVFRYDIVTEGPHNEWREITAEAAKEVLQIRVGLTVLAATEVVGLAETLYAHERGVSIWPGV